VAPRARVKLLSPACWRSQTRVRGPYRRKLRNPHADWASPSLSARRPQHQQIVSGRGFGYDKARWIVPELVYDPLRAVS